MTYSYIRNFAKKRHRIFFLLLKKLLSKHTDDPMHDLIILLVFLMLSILYDFTRVYVHDNEGTIMNLGQMPSI